MARPDLRAWRVGRLLILGFRLPLNQRNAAGCRLQDAALEASGLSCWCPSSLLIQSFNKYTAARSVPSLVLLLLAGLGPWVRVSKGDGS